MKRAITVELERSPDYPGIFDVVNITGAKGDLDECKVLGIPGIEKLEVGSWLRRKELGRVKQLPTKNKHIKFVLPE